MMISKFLTEQIDKQKKKKLIKVMISSLNIPEKQKYLYIEALEVLDSAGLENLYNNMTEFVKSLEKKENEDIHLQNFSSIGWLTKKQINEKTKEENAFSFLLNKL